MKIIYFMIYTHNVDMEITYVCDYIALTLEVIYASIYKIM